MEMIFFVISCLLFVAFVWGKKTEGQQAEAVIIMENAIRTMWKETGADTPTKQDDVAIVMLLQAISSIENREQYLITLSALRGMSNDIIKDDALRRKLKYDFLVYGEEKGWLTEKDLS